MFIGRTYTETEALILWSPDVKSWLIGKDPDVGRDWEQEEKGTTEDEMAGWHHWLDGYGFVWTPEVGDGQGGLVFCDSWGRKESDMTEPLIWAELKDPLHHYPPPSYVKCKPAGQSWLPGSNSSYQGQRWSGGGWEQESARGHSARL